MNWWVRNTKRFVWFLSYIEHFLILAPAYWIYSNFWFCFLLDIPIGITSFAIGLKICAITL